MITLLIAGGCALGWFVTARGLYHRWNDPHAFLSCPRTHERYTSGYSSCCLPEARGMPQGGAAALAMITAVVFPVVWATALVRWQPEKLRLMRSARGGVRIVKRTQVLAGKALEVAEREALDD